VKKEKGVKNELPSFVIFGLPQLQTTMYKSKFFTGQPIFSQVLSYLPRPNILAIAAEMKSDHYYKNFRTYEHLVTLLYGIFNRCNGLREVVTGLQAWEKRIHHLGISYQPRKSTLADANRDRSSEVFEKIYYDLYARYNSFLPDSRNKKAGRKLYIVDSTTISLFQEILKNAGRSPINGKRKGGVKVHTLIDSDHDVPCLIRMSAAASADVAFLKKINLQKGSVIVMDRGYAHGYQHLNRFDEEGIIWVSRLRGGSVYQVIQKNQITEYQKQKGVLQDQNILMGHDHHTKNKKVTARLIKFKDPESGQIFHFISNGRKLTATQIATYYKRRWQIETLFKRIKQNYPLQRFLGDTENAIKSQIWCALIADIILKVIKKCAPRSWSFSNLASTIRLHLMTYIDLIAFLKNPEKALLKRELQPLQISLFPT
jgi:hypothetical protein